ncbi:MAG: hypothetical protein M3N53_11415 [Actinomycetota bacterium]|nr:hypothetical protein [Actinomycetota bacterium]
MHTTLKAFLALAFVVVIGTVLIQPILQAVETAPVGAVRERQEADAGDKDASPPEPAEEPEPEPVPTPLPTEEPDDAAAAVSGPFRRQDLVAPYPKSCLARSASRAAGARIVVGTGPRLTVGSVAGRAVTTGRAGTAIGFDARGRNVAALARLKTLVVGPADLTQLRPRNQVRAWAWSPVGGCGFALGSDGSLVVETSRGETATLVDEGVRDVLVSPDGARLGIVVEEGRTTSVWVADLRALFMREIQRTVGHRGLSLRAWSPNGRILYLSLARGSGLSFVSTAEPPQEGGIVAAPVTNLELCGKRLLGIVNGSVAAIGLRGRDYLTETDAGYSAASCSPDGGFIAAVRAGRLVLLNGNGTLVRELVTDTGYRDVFVDWGPRGAGLIFGRKRSGAKSTEVWHIAEGGTARNTGLVYRGAGSVDWSATPPTGLATSWRGASDSSP